MWPIGRISAAQRRDVHARAARHDGAAAARASRAARCRRCSTRSRARRSGSTASTTATAPATASATSSTSTRGRRRSRASIADADDGDGAGHDHEHRARPVPARPVGRAGREPRPQRAGAPSVGGEFGEFLEFETLTLCPIDTRCIERVAAARRRDRLARTPTTRTVASASRRASTAPRWPGCARAPRRSERLRPARPRGAGGAAFVAPERSSSARRRPSSQARFRARRRRA